MFQVPVALNGYAFVVWDLKLKLIAGAHPQVSNDLWLCRILRGVNVYLDFLSGVHYLDHALIGEFTVSLIVYIGVGNFAGSAVVCNLRFCFVRAGQLTACKHRRNQNGQYRQLKLHLKTYP